MNRDELIEAGAEAIKPALLTYAQALARPSPIHLAQVVVHAVEPLIRADERDKESERNAPAVVHLLLAAEERRARLADLHAQVEALPGWQHGDAVLRSDVLELLDGRTDGQRAL